jgi:hypothetical protein
MWMVKLFPQLRHSYAILQLQLSHRQRLCMLAGSFHRCEEAAWIPYFHFKIRHQDDQEGTSVQKHGTLFRVYSPQKSLKWGCLNIKVSKTLEAARFAGFIFDSSLSNHDRAVVHDLCKKLGLISKSHGCADSLFTADFWVIRDCRFLGYPLPQNVQMPIVSQ